MKFSGGPASFLALLLSVFAAASSSLAFSDEPLFFYRGDTLDSVSILEFEAAVTAADFLLIGERHDSASHHRQQTQILRMAFQKHPFGALGMEFISYDQQSSLDRYLKAEITESEFLQEVSWSGIPFSEYRNQVQMPLEFGGWTFGINLPRSVARQISKLGLKNIEKSAADFLPPDPQLGNAAYFERFKAAMQGHVPAEKLQNYFEAQSMWDDTMAWQLASIFARDQRFTAVIVGEFHIAYGGGLPDRLQARSQAAGILTLSQISDCSELKRDPLHGPRADFLLSSVECRVSQP